VCLNPFLGMRTGRAASNRPNTADPQLLLEAIVEGGPKARTWLWANVVGGVLPLMERLGVATRSEVDPTTLAERLLAELAANDGAMIGPPLVGAWATVQSEG
jgi:hypothetical protein